MRYGSVCSGIEAASVAWHGLGWEPAFFSEIEAFPRAVLHHHWPHVPAHGDFTTIRGDEYGPVQLLVGGTPCQSFSLAGLRGGMGDERGNLALEYIKLADRLRPRWLVWENVPGVFSSRPGAPPQDDDGDAGPVLGHNGGPPLGDTRFPVGHDFACFLSGLVRWEVPIPEGGWRNSGIIQPGPVDGAYGVAWRVLDAQHAGIPQRRRRVFVVGYLGDWRRAAAVLFERHSLQGHSAPRRRSGAQASGAPGAGPAAGGGFGDIEAGGMIPEIAETLRAGGNRTGGDRPPGTDADTAATYLIPVMASREDPVSSPEVFGALSASEPQAQAIAFTAKDLGQDAAEELAPTLRSMGHDGSHANGGGQVAVAFALRGRDEGAVPEVHGEGDTIGTLRAANGGSSRDYVATTAVRRLMPVECERLQGFPDGHTDVTYRGKPAADGPRYKALGNSMAVPVMRYLGERIAMVDALP